MASKIIIDGYNLIKSSPTLDSDGYDLESDRDNLIDMLAKYYGIKKIPITVVFDGWQGGQPIESHDLRKRINIIFSCLGEKADEVIKRLAKEKGSSAIVVSSDREIADYAERQGATVVSSAEFEGKLTMALYMIEKGVDFEEEDDDRLDRPLTTKKKGNPRKLPRSERKRKNKVKRL